MTKRPKNSDLIKDEWRDPDGYWILLIDGWKNGYDGSHFIGEDTKHKAYGRLSTCESCTCSECVLEDEG